MLRALIVDDHEEIAEIFGGALLEAGVEWDAAKTANEAAAMAVRQSYDLVLMDMALRRSSGITAALALRGLGYQGPIFAVTAGLLPVDDILFKRVGFAETLTKPLQLEQLVEAARAHLPGDE